VSSGCPASPRGRIVGAVGVGLLLAGLVVALLGSAASRTPYLDLTVYQEAVRIWWGGGSPYGVGLVDGLVFYYPPSALVLLGPLALLPPTTAGALLGVLGAGALVAAVMMVGRPRPVAALAITGLAALSEPVQATWRYGQVNLVVMGLTVLGIIGVSTRPHTWWRGAAVGVAAGIKLQPLALLLVPALQRRWSTVAAALGTAAALVGVAEARSPGIVVYWLDDVRGGAVDGRAQDAARNASWRGLLDTLVTDTSTARAVWVVVAALVVVAAVGGAVLATRGGRPAVALSVLALGILLAWPVSWTHHWVWVPVVLASTLAPVGVRALDRAALGCAALLALATLAWLPAWFATADHSLGSEGLTWVVSYSYVLLGTAALVALVLRELRAPASGPPAATS
jgi:alpha-1,2-mannosyltransferase